MSVSIASSAVLVDLNISVWTARKLDKNVSKEIAVSKQTVDNAGNYSKHLLTGADQLDKINKLAGTIREWHARQTLPWSDSGTRLLPMLNFFDYKQQLNDYEQQFNDLVAEFLDVYPNLISVMAFRLGQLFDVNEYPAVDKVANKFGLRYTIIPVPEVGDFRVEVGETMRKEIETQYEKAYAARVESAVGDAWSRLHTTLEHMIDRLSGDDKKIFRNSLVDNALELTSLLTKLNITNDPKLERARVTLEQSLMGVTPDELRTSPAIRADVLARVNQIMESI
jgi:hypothetical protein